MNQQLELLNLMKTLIIIIIIKIMKNQIDNRGDSEIKDKLNGNIVNTRNNNNNSPNNNNNCPNSPNNLNNQNQSHVHQPRAVPHDTLLLSHLKVNIIIQIKLQIK